MIKQQTQSKGAAMLFFILLFLFASTALTFILTRTMFSDMAILHDLITSKQAFLVSESAAEEVAYRHVFGTYSVDNVETLTFNNIIAVATSTFDGATDEFIIESKANKEDSFRTSQIILTVGSGSAFNYGLQAGSGGIDLANSAGIIGNVYSNGPITGAGSSIVRGEVVSAGPSGYIYNIHATGSAYAHTIEDSLVEGDIYVATPLDDITNSVLGTKYLNEPDLPTADLPISTTTVAEWKQAIIDYGTIIQSTDPECSGGTYTIDDPATIGYIKIECDLDVKDQGSPATVLTLTGPVWVEGNISFTSGPDIEVDPALGRRSVQMIADNESDRLTSSQIEIRNSTNFSGSGDSRSYIMLFSANESASLGGTEIAIDVSQSTNGSLIVYSGNGLIDIGNGIDLKEVTGYQINVAQNSDITYELGLADLMFTSGPGGAYVVSDWSEIE